ncbi:MAG: LysM peptidoglycan-binding domain-containing protein [Acidimicrobiales bacterium]
MTATIDPLLIPAPVRRVSSRPAPHLAPGTARRGRPTAWVFRRRRMVVTGFVFAAATLLLTSGAFATEPSPSNLETVPRTHVVEAGDTLWSIAREYVPTGSISELVYEMARINGVDIEVGQVVRIP